MKKLPTNLTYTLLVIAIWLFPSISQAQFEQFAESYSLLSTIAGKGEMDDRGTVGWKSEYEGGSATEAELTRPHFAMADMAGNIYIADKDAHGIRKVTPEGVITTVAGTNIAGDNGDGIGTETQLNAPNGLWVKFDGTLYILDLGNGKIRRLNNNGHLETIVDDPAGISIGRGLWVTDSEDSIYYACGSKIKLWSKTGGIIDFSTGYSSLGNICMDKNGFLIATDRSAHAVYRINKDGSSKVRIAGNGTTTGGGNGELATETGLNEVRAVWFLDDNSYFVGTHEGSQVWYVDNSSKIYLFLDGRNGDEYHNGDGENYRTPGYKISEVRSLSVDYEGNVLITENDLGYVRKIKNDYMYFYTNTTKTNNQTSVFQAFPTIAIDEITVSLNGVPTNTYLLEIVNTVGKVVKSTSTYTTYQTRINISDLESGLYFCNLYTSKGVSTQKFIINRF